MTTFPAGASSANCMFGCNTVEKVHHLFFGCSHCSAYIIDFQLIYKRKRVDYCLKTLFTKLCVQARVELFLKRIFDF